MEAITIEIIAIAVAAIVAIGVAIYQVRSSKQKSFELRGFESKNRLWASLNAVRSYYDLGMSDELNEIGTLELKPILEFRETVNEEKLNISSKQYTLLTNLYEQLSKRTNDKIFQPMKDYLNSKDKISESEFNANQSLINKERQDIVKLIEVFMENNKSNF